MKTKHNYRFLAALLGVLLISPLSSTTLLAQDDPMKVESPGGDQPEAKPEGDRKGPKGPKADRERKGPGHGELAPPRLMKKLFSEEEIAKLKAARETALEDPALKEARKEADNPKEFREALVAKMIAVDPSVEPLLEKLKDAMKDGPREGKMGDRPGKASPEEQAKLREARKAAMDDPAVKAAKEKVSSAVGAEDKKAAQKELREALNAAMAKANPETAAILEKMEKGGKPKGGEPEVN